MTEKQISKCKFLFMKSKDVVTTNEYPTVESVFNRLMEADPDKGMNCFWLMKQFKNKQFDINDIKNVRQIISKFLDNRISLPESDRSLEKYDYNELEELTKRWSNIIDIDSSIDNSNPNVRVIYNGKYGKLSVPLNAEESCSLGSGTKWCTAAKRNNEFNAYDQDLLYIWEDYLSKKKYQFYLARNEFKNAQNKDINPTLLEYYKNEHPILKQLFEQQNSISHIIKTPPLAVKHAKDVIKGRWYEAEPYIMKNGKHAYYYAKDVIQDRWKEAEPYIMKDPFAAYHYANNILDSRWIRAEPYIKRNPFYSAMYAGDVLKRRWPEVEHQIMKYPSASYHYARDVIKGRWYEAEPYIMEDPGFSTRYARDVIKGRWIEAEPYIMKDPEYWDDYKNRFNL